MQDGSANVQAQAKVVAPPEKMPLAKGYSCFAQRMSSDSAYSATNSAQWWTAIKPGGTAEVHGPL